MCKLLTNYKNSQSAKNDTICILKDKSKLNIYFITLGSKTSCLAVKLALKKTLPFLFIKQIKCHTRLGIKRGCANKRNLLVEWLLNFATDIWIGLILFLLVEYQPEMIESTAHIAQVTIIREIKFPRLHKVVPFK